jgi:hypothetical protein
VAALEEIFPGVEIDPADRKYLEELRLVTAARHWQKRALAAEALVARWKAAIEPLTPGGSEYAGDPEACGAVIRGKLDLLHKTAVRFKHRLNALEGKDGG